MGFFGTQGTGDHRSAKKKAQQALKRTRREVIEKRAFVFLKGN